MDEKYLKLQNGSDVRGVALEGIEGQAVNLTVMAAQNIAAGFAVWLGEKSNKPVNQLRIGVGRDSRLSGPILMQAVTHKLCELGVNVYNCSIASTPSMFYSTVGAGFMYDGSIMLTASHLPYNRNGLKFFTKAGGTEKADVTAILRIAAKEQFQSANLGSITEVDLISAYSQTLVDLVKERTGKELPLKGLKIVVDAGNGAGGFYATKVLQPLGADTTGSLYLDPDGTFKNHIPNPEDKVAMDCIVNCAKQNKADMGIIFDTDVDRAGAVDELGNPLNRNRLIAAISAILLEKEPTTIVTDSITSDGLKAFIEKKGGIHHRFKRGYKNVINEAIRLNSLGQDCKLAIETSGHGALKENYFLDDGAYLVTLLLVALAQGKKLSTLTADLAEPKESQEFRMIINYSDFKSYGENVITLLAVWANEHNWRILPNNFEGIRISFPKGRGDGWFLLRLSLHDPLLPLNIESDTVGGVKIIANALYDFLLQFDKLDLTPLEKEIL